MPKKRGGGRKISGDGKKDNRMDAVETTLSLRINIDWGLYFNGCIYEMNKGQVIHR